MKWKPEIASWEQDIITQRHVAIEEWLPGVRCTQRAAGENQVLFPHFSAAGLCLAPADHLDFNANVAMSLW
jgi:hypothetical protein